MVAKTGSRMEGPRPSLQKVLGRVLHCRPGTTQKKEEEEEEEEEE